MRPFRKIRELHPITEIEENVGKNINDILHDDELHLIFGYLPIVDRVRVEGVCKRWQEVSLNSWSNLKTLNGNQKIWGFGSQDPLDIEDDLFQKVIKRCGKYLTCLDLDGFRYLSSRSVQIICQRCSNLQVLHLGRTFSRCACPEMDQCGDCTGSSSRAMEMLLSWKVCSQLRKFGTTVIGLEEQDFANLVSKMPKLELLEIDHEGQSRYEGSFLRNLPLKTLKETILLSCEHLGNEENLISAIKQIPTLRTAVLTRLPKCNIISEALVPQAETLKTLALHYVSVDKTKFMHILQLVNLERLCLCDNDFVDDEFFGLLVQKCKKLIYLHIRSCYQVTDAGLLHLSKLPQLQYLFVDNLSKVTGASLKEMKNLKALSCMNCRNVEDEASCNIVQQLPRLQILDVSYCEKLTNKFLETVVEVVKKRGNGVTLQLNISKNEKTIDISKIGEIPSQLKIVDTINYPQFFAVNFFYSMLIQTN